MALPRLRGNLHLAKRFIRSSSMGAPYLLSPSQLQDLLNREEHVKVLDATWFMPNTPRNPRKEFLAKHIPKAQFLDLDEVASPHPLGLKHMLPSESTFANACENFGIRPDTHVVLYDTHGVFSSPRALYMFRSFGHSNSSIVDGGLPLWEMEGLWIESGQEQVPQKSQYPKPTFDTNSVRSYEQMVENADQDLSSQDVEVVLDARSRGRYLGTDPEPRPGLSSGHIPHSFMLPFNMFLQTNQGPTATYTTFRSTTDIRKALHEAVGSSQAESIINGQRSAVTTCGSGMTAGILWLGLRLLGAPKTGLYDESWTGYAMRPTSKIAKGE
ncbi:Rhodanese-like protein [Marasmius fiardii PR-910]|nr:Rhodanese-like protein [Marasmius fiardii PR-910]